MISDNLARLIIHGQLISEGDFPLSKNQHNEITQHQACKRLSS